MTALIMIVIMAGSADPVWEVNLDIAAEGLTNRLSEETSPYLLSHADNPVNWQPWDAQAFEAARTLNRPVFLSIGYSTCHWCHVMEEESFMDSTVADLMNSAFVCIKVDREERPDVDNRYMRYAMAMTGSGGWPLNVVLTPDGLPFFAATYIPRENAWGRRGMLQLVPMLQKAWSEDRERMLESAEQIAAAVPSGLPRSDALSSEPVRGCFSQLESSYDSVNGGFGRAPKFPSLHNVLFLLRYWHFEGLEKALDMSLATLAAIRYGGIYDQLGGGVHRYSTDEGWRIPHYEKMLYDQAMFSLTALEAYQASGRELYREMAETTIDFVLREMTSPGGGFYSAMDADDPDGEGAYYSWDISSLSPVLGPDDARDVAQIWNLETGSSGTPRLTPPESWNSVPNEIPAPGDRIMEMLLKQRQQRRPPALDRKVLADWNGMMIAALCRAASVLDRADYAEAARRAMLHITGNMISREGHLLHSWIGGEAGEHGFLNDYACMIWASIEMYSLTLEEEYLELAFNLQRMQDSLFLGSDATVYSFACRDDPSVPVTVTVEVMDGAAPSGNSISLMNLHRLSSLSMDPVYRSRAASLSETLLSTISSSPASGSMMLAAVLSGPAHVHVTLYGDPGSGCLDPFLDVLRQHYLPDATISLESSSEEPRAVICREGACSPPVRDPSELAELLNLD